MTPTMFPREITTSAVWIRHQLPLFAPPPLNGDQSLRRQIKSRLVHSTESEINEAVRLERARLDLKWCLDEFFGGPLSEFSLGQIVTANIFGVVRLGYIVNTTSFGLTVLPADTFGSVAVIGFDDVYSGEHSPFFHTHLRHHRVYHPQHVLDWWTRCTVRKPVSSFHLAESSSSATADTAMCEWHTDDKTWVTHAPLPQRDQFVHLPERVIQRPAPSTPVEHFAHSFPTPALSESTSPLLNTHSHNVHRCSRVTVGCQLSTSALFAHADVSHPVVLDVQRSSTNKPVSTAPLSFYPSSPFFIFSSCPRVKQFLPLILAICFVIALSPSILHDVESSSTIVSATLLGSLSIPAFLLVFQNLFEPRLLSHQKLLHSVRRWD